MSVYCTVQASSPPNEHPAALCVFARLPTLHRPLHSQRQADSSNWRMLVLTLAVCMRKTIISRLISQERWDLTVKTEGPNSKW